MIRNKAIINALLIALLAGCARNEPPSEVVQERRIRPYHVVKAGETTIVVAQKYKMREDELIRINHLKPPYTLIPGQRLLVYPQDEKEGTTEQPSVNDGPTNVVQDSDISVKSLDDTGANQFAQGQGNDHGGISVGSVGQVGSAAAGLAGAVGGSATDASSPIGANGEVITPEAAVTQTAEKKLLSASGPVTYDWPVQGKIIQSFGQSLPDGSISEGINISAPMGTKIKAATDGIIKDAGSKIPAYGNMVVVKHNDGTMSIYAHMKELFVKQPVKGEVIRVTKGQVIGTVGKTGIAKQPQLYFQVRSAAPQLKPIDPTTLLP